MNSKLTILAAALLLPHAAQAEEAVKAEPYQLKNRSSFTATEDTRAPFWPIGWSKRVTQATPVSTAAPVLVKTTIDPNNFKITSILLGSPSLAVINGRAYGEGEYIKTPRTSAPPTGQAAAPRILVQRITDSSVVLQQGDQQATVSFHRPGLAAKVPGRDLLLEDR